MTERSSSEPRAGGPAETARVAHLEQEPAEIADRLGIRFTPGSDDLGELVEAGIEMASGRLLLFLRYTGSAAPGTSVLADARDDLQSAEK